MLKIDFRQIFSFEDYSNTHKLLRIFGVNIKIRRRFTYKKFKKLPVNPRKIIFNNFSGDGYGCNPKYIAEEIINRNLPYELVWLISDTVEVENRGIPLKIKLVDINSEQAIEELATSKIWIDNQRKIQHIGNGLEKKLEQIYIQTWHGALGIKRLDNDVKAFQTSKKWVKKAKYDSQMADYLLSNSEFESEILPRALWFNNEVLKVGHPRNDIFFKNKEELNIIKQKVFEKLNISIDKKVLLYIPSFRDDYNLDCYHLDVALLRKNLAEYFSGEWVVAIRLHPRLKNFAESLFNFGDENIVNASLYPDIQELLVSSDVAVSDYSSCIFDFMLSRKPAFVYAEDIEKYNTDRGFYYPLESTPFPVSRNNDELCQNIKNFDCKKYKEDVENFLEEKGCIEDGHASERIVNIIEQIVGQK